MANTTEKVLKCKIQAVDKFTKPMKQVIKSTQTFKKVASKIKPIILKAQDKASPVINKAKAQIDRFKNTKVGQVVLKATDKASKVTSTVTSKLRAFTGKVYSATISLKDKASSVIGGIKGKLGGLKGMIAAALGGATLLGGFKTGLEGLGQEQTQKITINRVFENSGSTQKQAQKQTQEYYKYLEEYANKTPFTTQEMTAFGTKSALIAKGDVNQAKQLTDAQANVKAFVGKLRLPTCYSDVA